MKNRVEMIDSIIEAGNADSGMNLLVTLKPHIGNDDPALPLYYTIRAPHFIYQPDLMNEYADSALNFFNDKSRIRQYPNEYFKALLVKGDACKKKADYVTALNYYYKARTVLPAIGCNNGDLDTKIGSIYYDQKNFIFAARCWGSSYYRLLACNGKLTRQKLFEVQQADLNNAGFSYERAGNLDSANYFYQLNAKLIDSGERIHLATPAIINGARTVLCDNLGGLNIKWGRLSAAEDYLKKCLSIPTDDADGIQIPPLLKLAEVYLKKQEYEKAAPLFKESRALLDRFEKDNPGSEIKWNLLYADYLFKQQKPGEAYFYQDKYIKLRDSLDNYSSDLYRLDVERELRSISQKQQLIDLEQKDKIRLLSLLGISSVVVLSVIIIILINRNLRRSQKNTQAARLQNQQLKQTLDELERVNKNYIRIMRVMAHDLRNPLSGMTGLAANLLEEDEFSKESRHLLELIQSTGIHTMEMISELLKSGLTDENAPVQKQTVDLRELLYDSVELLQFKANEKHQELIFESDNTPIVTEVNHENIWRVFNNLIVNAIKFSYENGKIRVGVKILGNHILITVADNGVGIPDKDKENIFEMFTPSKKTGTHGEEPFGLGLSISKKIIERHSGKIWFESVPGTGTTFFIELPLTSKK